MNPIQIAYFKHFLYDKDLHRSYIFYYRQNRIKGSPSGDKDGNPESIEQYFLKTTVEDVIMKAFYFYPNTGSRSNSSYDYWKGIDDQWQDYMKSNDANFTNDKWPLLSGTFAILRQNWDADCYWMKRNFESTEEVYRRLGVDMPMPPFIWEHGDTPMKRLDEKQINFDIHNAKDGDIVVRIRKFENGGVGRTTFIVKKVVRYDPETSYLQPNQLHCKWDPERKNVYIAYLHASYNSMGEELRTTLTEGHQIHAVVNDDSDVTRYRLAFDEEVDILTKRLAERGLAWNLDKKEVVPLSEAKEEEQPLIEFSDEEEDDPLADFDFFDDVLPRNYRLKPNEVSINFNNSNKITFNQFESKTIRESGLKFARLARNKVGDICLIINNREGVNISNLAGKANNQNTTINSVNICGKLRNLFHLKPDYSVLSIEKLQTTQEFIIYKITKQ